MLVNVALTGEVSNGLDVGASDEKARTERVTEAVKRTVLGRHAGHPTCPTWRGRMRHRPGLIALAETFRELLQLSLSRLRVVTQENLSRAPATGVLDCRQ